jgi:hypothetical protein
MKKHKLRKANTENRHQWHNSEMVSEEAKEVGITRSLIEQDDWKRLKAKGAKQDLQLEQVSI